MIRSRAIELKNQESKGKRRESLPGNVSGKADAHGWPRSQGRNATAAGDDMDRDEPFKIDHTGENAYIYTHAVTPSSSAALTPWNYAVPSPPKSQSSITNVRSRVQRRKDGIRQDLSKWLGVIIQFANLPFR